MLFKSLLFFVIIYSCSCRQKPAANPKADKIALMEVDRAFSKLSLEKGMKQAFLEYIDSNGILLRPNHMPIIGAGAVDFLIQQDDRNFSISWRPNGADISSSGDLGYTYGVYVVVPAEKDTAIYGTYVSIWKKQHDGSWKFSLDSGNPGIGENEN